MNEKDQHLSLSEKVVLEDLDILPHRLVSGLEILRSFHFLSASERLAKYEELNKARARHRELRLLKNSTSNKKSKSKNTWSERLRAQKRKFAVKILGFSPSFDTSPWSFPVATLALTGFLFLAVFFPIVLIPLVIIALSVWGEASGTALFREKEHEHFVSEFLRLLEKSPAAKDHVQKNPHLLDLIEKNLISSYHAKELMCSINRFLTEKRQEDKVPGALALLRGLQEKREDGGSLKENGWVDVCCSEKSEDLSQIVQPELAQKNQDITWRI